MELALGFSLLLFWIFLANWLVVQQKPTWTKTFNLLLMGGNSLLLLVGIGIGVGVVPATAGISQPAPFAITLCLMGIIGQIILLSQIRQLIAKRFAINPQSPVHTLALLLSIYLMGNTFLTLSQGGLETLAETAKTAPIFEVLLSGTVFVLVAFISVGLGTRRSGKELFARLGLQPFTRSHFRQAVLVLGILLIAQTVLGGVWTLIAPEQSELVESITSTLLQDVDTIGEWLLLALATGIGEELLFRGAIQPIFGLNATSFLFAISHIQYGLTPATLFVFLLGFLLGWLRERTSTTTTIFIHFAYNLTLGLLAMLASALEPLIQ